MAAVATRAHVAYEGRPASQHEGCDATGRQALTIVISLMISAQRLGQIAASQRMLWVHA
jgi:hypothetical protein